MRYQERVWTFETAQFRIECFMAPDDVDTSFDETGETVDKLRSGEWSAFATEVRVTHKETGAKLGSDHLGGSIYADPRDFLKEHYGSRPKGYGAYFPDMVREAIGEARKRLKALQAARIHV